MAAQLERRIRELEQRSHPYGRPAREWSTAHLEAYVSELLGIDRPPTDEELQHLIDEQEGARNEST